ncbi:transposase [Dactylosporangium sp. NPDC051484]|uniref:transposase n=1 Tax=Dactylosporangium sp. NPDC051484 TaxID=3154942 RepID=UPI00344EF50D
MRGEHADALLDEPADLPAPTGAPIATARTHPDREEVRDLPHRFYRRYADADLPELERLATTVETWRLEILAFPHSGITNRVIKTIAREACGFRNPINQRRRTRTATTRKARGHLGPREFRRAPMVRRATTVWPAAIITSRPARGSMGRRSTRCQSQPARPP